MRRGAGLLSRILAALRGQVGVGFLALGLAAHLAHEPVEEGEGGRLALVIAVGVRILNIHQAVGAAEGLHHLVGEAVQLIVGEAHLVYHVVHGLDVQLTGALQAQPLVVGLPVRVHAGYKYYRHVFLAA